MTSLRKFFLLIAFVALLMAACIEKAPAATINGGIVINPATGQEIARVVGLTKDGPILDREVNWPSLFIVERTRWTRGKCGVCHGR